MKQLLISTAFVLLVNLWSTAQINVRGSNIQDFTGKPIINNAVSEVQGSFFYNQEYKNTKIYLVNGTELPNSKVKLDLHDNIIFYLN